MGVGKHADKGIFDLTDGIARTCSECFYQDFRRYQNIGGERRKPFVDEYSLKIGNEG